MAAYFARTFYPAAYFAGGYWGPAGSTPPVGVGFDYLMFARRIGRR
jgi:hypothetical protein